MKKTWMLMVFLCISLMAWGQDIETIKAKAQAGDPEAQVELGKAYLEGKEGLTKDEATAVKWFRKAAEQGNAEGQYELGVCYFYGQGIISNNKEAERWLRKSADQCYATSYRMLGYYYKLQKDKSTAIYWYKKYADYAYENNWDLGFSILDLQELGVNYDPSIKEKNNLNSSASDKVSQSECPHSFSYTYNPNGLYIEATDEKNIIIMENYADNFVTANLSVIAVDESSKILSIILSESKSVGRISKLLWKGSANLAITLSNGEVFRCSSNACSIKKGYGSLTTSMSASAGFLNLRSTNSPSGNANKSYAEKQFSTYDITKIVLNDCTFVVRSDTSSDKERMMRSACTIKAMLDDLKKRIE